MKSNKVIKLRAAIQNKLRAPKLSAVHAARISRLALYTFALALAALAAPSLSRAQVSQQAWFTPKQSNRARGLDLTVSGEANLDIGTSRSGLPGRNSDGPNLVLDLRLAEQVKLHVKLAFDRLISLDHSRLARAWDFQSWLEEAYIVLECPKGSAGCFAVTIGKQPIPVGLFESGLPVDKVNPMKGLSQEKGVYGIRIAIDQAFAGALDQVAFSIFRVVRDPKNLDFIDDDGDTTRENGTGGNVYFAKSLTDKIKIGGGFTAIAFKSYSKLQLNAGLVYKFNDGCKVFAEGVYVSHYSLYPRAHAVFSVGFVAKVGKGHLAGEVTHLQNTKDEFALGYTWEITDTWSVGPEVIYDLCQRRSGSVCRNGLSGLMRLSYHRNEEDERPPELPPGTACTVGDPIPGCSSGLRVPEEPQRR